MEIPGASCSLSFVKVVMVARIQRANTTGSSQRTEKSSTDWQRKKNKTQLSECSCRVLEDPGEATGQLILMLDGLIEGTSIKRANPRRGHPMPDKK